MERGRGRLLDEGWREVKLIVAGGRDFADFDLLAETLFPLGDFELVCGEAKGADLLGRKYAELAQLPIHSFPADWESLGRRAGFFRNARMASFADELVAFWDGESRGTQHMIRTMQALGKPVIVVRYERK